MYQRQANTLFISFFMRRDLQPCLTTYSDVDVLLDFIGEEKVINEYEGYKLLNSIEKFNTLDINLLKLPSGREIIFYPRHISFNIVEFVVKSGYAIKL